FIPVRMVTFSVASAIGLGIWLASQIMGGLVTLGASGGVANWAHIGGFFYGMLMAIMLRMETEGHSDYLAEEAEEALRVGNWHGAIERYVPLLADDPENVAAHIGLGTAYSMIGDDARAITHYEEGVRLLCGRSEPAQALVVYREMKAAYPEYTPPAKLQYDLGCACEDTDPAQAYEEFDGVHRLHPDSPEGQMALLKTAQLCLRVLGRPAEAIQRFTTFMERYHDSLWSVAAQDGLREAQAALNRDQHRYRRPGAPGPLIVPRS
ncbi:MAG: tetratricopeptide repeat protein, partial [Armatimonadota bacterium]